MCWTKEWLNVCRKDRNRSENPCLMNLSYMIIMQIPQKGTNLWQIEAFQGTRPTHEEVTEFFQNEFRSLQQAATCGREKWIIRSLLSKVARFAERGLNLYLVLGITDTPRKWVEMNRGREALTVGRLTKSSSLKILHCPLFKKICRASRTLVMFHPGSLAGSVWLLWLFLDWRNKYIWANFILSVRIFFMFVFFSPQLARILRAALRWKNLMITPLSSMN